MKMSNKNNIKYPMGRYERKFFARDFTLKDIENLIKTHPALFYEIYLPRRVNNIYFDSLDLENYYDNIEGNTRRLKVRIRWYGEMFGLIKNPILELKIKNEDVGRKMNFPLKEFVLDESFSNNKLHDNVFAQSGLPHWLIEKLKLCKPALLNYYERRYFLSMDKKYRLTIDSNLGFFEIKDKANIFLHSIEDQETIILELKYDKNDDYKIAEITQHFPFRLNKSSKYISGINLLDLF